MAASNSRRTAVILAVSSSARSASCLRMESVQSRPRASRAESRGQKSQADIQTACAEAVKKGALQKAPPSDPIGWVLHQYIEIAAELGLVEAATAVQARLAKDFRNLIHPGRAINKQEVCDRGTALSANAAVELVSRDLRARFP